MRQFFLEHHHTDKRMNERTNEPANDYRQRVMLLMIITNVSLLCARVSESLMHLFKWAVHVASADSDYDDVADADANYDVADDDLLSQHEIQSAVCQRVTCICHCKWLWRRASCRCVSGAGAAVWMLCIWHLIALLTLRLFLCI